MAAAPLGNVDYDFSSTSLNLYITTASTAQRFRELSKTQFPIHDGRLLTMRKLQPLSLNQLLLRKL